LGDNKSKNEINDIQEDENYTFEREEVSQFSSEDDKLFIPETIENENTIEYMEFTDPRDNKQYRIIELVGKTWFADNLNSNHSESFCYNNEDAMCEEFGRLYSWDAAKEVCPMGWRLPKIEEWEQLIEGFGGNSNSFFELQKSGSSGFDALFGGDTDGENYQMIGKAGYFWSFDEENENKAYYFAFNKKLNLFYGKSGDKKFDMSCRCIFDDDKSIIEEDLSNVTFVQPPPINPPYYKVFIDERDEKLYNFMTIGDLDWMADNLNYNAKESKMYDNSEAFANKYGRLYSWEEAFKSCPDGWRLPKTKEWDKLIEVLNTKPTLDFNIKKHY